MEKFILGFLAGKPFGTEVNLRSVELAAAMGGTKINRVAVGVMLHKLAEGGLLERTNRVSLRLTKPDQVVPRLHALWALEGKKPA